MHRNVVEEAVPDLGYRVSIVKVSDIFNFLLFDKDVCLGIAKLSFCYQVSVRYFGLYMALCM